MDPPEDDVIVAPLLAVRDLERSVEFYALLGLLPEVRFDSYARLSSPTAVIHLAVEGPAPPDRPEVAMQAPPRASSHASTIIVVEVRDCVAFCAGLQGEGVEIIAGPSVPEWGGEIRAFAFDPDGHLLEIHQSTGLPVDH